jgi:multicomponent Na+:H+ antiporter subunit B
VLGGDPPFTHVPGPGEDVAHIGSLELISAVAFDVGVFLVVVSLLVLLIHHLSSLVREPEQ